MAIDAKLNGFDPSKFTVYQMLEDTDLLRENKFRHELKDGIYNFRLQPHSDTLYSNAYILKETLSIQDIQTITQFFGEETFKIKITPTPLQKKVLLENRYIPVGVSAIMERGLPQETPTPTADIRPIRTADQIEIFSDIFAQAFGVSSEAASKKFGFLNTLITEEKEQKIEAYLLYKDGKAVSTGGYYAYDNFSIENIATLPEHQGNGYATEILKRLFFQAKQLGYKQVILSASEAGRPVYERIGFTTNRLITTFMQEQ